MLQLKRLWNPRSRAKRILNSKLFDFWDDVFYLDMWNLMLFIGHMGSGKSAKICLGEEYFYLNGFGVFDLMGSPIDHENLSPLIHSKNRKYPVGVIVPPYVNFRIPHDSRYQGYVRVFSSETPIAEIIEECVKEFRMILIDNTSFSEEHFRLLVLEYFKELPTLFRKSGLNWVVGGREMYTLMPVRGTPTTGDNTGQVTEEIKDFFRNIRKSKGSMLLDIQRLKEFDKGARDMMNIKAVCRTVNPRLNIPEDSGLGWFLDDLDRYRLNNLGSPHFAAHAGTYPLVNELKPNQCYFVKAEEHNFFKRFHIPLPGFHYLSTRTEVFESLTGIVIERDAVEMKRFLVGDKDAEYNKHRECIINIVSQGVCTPRLIYDDISWEYGMSALVKLLDFMKKTGELKSKGQGVYDILDEVGVPPVRAGGFIKKKGWELQINDFLNYDRKPSGIDGFASEVCNVFLQNKLADLKMAYNMFLAVQVRFKPTFQQFSDHVKLLKKELTLPQLAFEPDRISPKYLEGISQSV